MTTPSIPLTPGATETTPNDGETTPLPPSPTRTHYQQIAAQFLQAFNAASALVPKLEASHSTTINFVRGHANAPLKFLATVTSAVEQLPELSALGKLDTEVAYDRLQYIAAFRPLANTVNAFLQSLLFTLNAQQAELTADSLQVYDITKGLARDPRSAHLGTFLKAMKRDLGRPGRPKKKESATDPTTPATPAPSSPPATNIPPKPAA